MRQLSHLKSVEKPSVAAVIRSLAGDGHIVGVAFGHTGSCNAHKLSFVQSLNVGCTAIAHSGTQTAKHLIHHFVERPLERHSGGNALGHGPFALCQEVPGAVL